MIPPLIIVGAGGHARVVVDALLVAGLTIRGMVDGARRTAEAEVFGIPVLGGDDVLVRPEHADCGLVNGIGGVGSGESPTLRQRVQERLQATGRRFFGVRHPSAVISPRASLADDVQVFAGAVIQAGADIQQGAVINSRALVEHDCRVGAFSHCAPGAVICGDVVLGEGVHIGAGAVVRQGIRLGSGTVVAAGAAVVADHHGAGTLMGVPARLRT